MAQPKDKKILVHMEQTLYSLVYAEIAREDISEKSGSSYVRKVLLDHFMNKGLLTSSIVAKMTA